MSASDVALIVCAAPTGALIAFVVLQHIYRENDQRAARRRVRALVHELAEWSESNMDDVNTALVNVGARGTDYTHVLADQLLDEISRLRKAALDRESESRDG